MMLPAATVISRAGVSWRLSGSLFFSPVVSGAATSPPLGRSGDNLALAPLPLALLSGVLPVVVISSKLEVVLLPRDLSGVLYKKIALLQLDPKIPLEIQ